MASASGSPKVTLVDSGPTFEVWRGPQGMMRLDWNRMGTILITNAGHGHAEFAGPMCRKLDDIVKASHSLLHVCDWHDLATYDSAFRTDHAKTIISHMSVWKGAHVITTSKLVHMGLAVANLGLGGKIKTYQSRTEFDMVMKKLGFSPVSLQLSK